MDQFAKLAFLLRTDFIASQYGRQHAKNPAEFPISTPCQRSISPVASAFGNAVGIKLDPDWRGKVLPRTPFLLNLHCWLLGRNQGDSIRFSALTFCGERGLHNLLRTKGVAGGRNIEAIDGRNVRVGLDGKNDEEAILTVWNDRIVPIGAADFPRDRRLEMNPTGLAAADITRAHMNLEKIDLPWHESSDTRPPS
jgi:hypothetical protein